MRPIDAEPVVKWLEGVAENAVEQQRVALEYAVKIIREAPTLTEKPTKREGENMTIDATVKVLSNERACVVRNTEGGCDRKCADCDLVLPDSVVLSAYGTAIDILLSQKEKEKNELLTLEGLGTMNGEPVFVTARYMSPGIPDTQAWMIVHVIDEVDIWLVDMLGDMWAANDPRITEIRRRPKEEVTQ